MLEHQSTVDARMPLRLWWSMGDIWRRHVQRYPEAETLPLIIPMVLHHSARGWTAATRMAELLALTPAMREALGEQMPRLSFYLEDLSQCADEELMARSMSALPRLALWALKNARSDIDLIAGMYAWREVFLNVLEAGHGVRALAAILRYILQVNQSEPDALEAFAIELGPTPSATCQPLKETRQLRERSTPSLLRFHSGANCPRSNRLASTHRPVLHGEPG